MITYLSVWAIVSTVWFVFTVVESVDVGSPDSLMRGMWYSAVISAIVGSAWPTLLIGLGYVFFNIWRMKYDE